MKKNIMNLLVSCACLSLSACSVGMALNGQKDPDMSVVKKGAYRPDVELQLGEPIKTSKQADGTTAALYEYEVGNEPSAGRAVAHGAMDVLTLGLWEVVGTPVELATGDKHKISVLYDQQDHVVKYGKVDADKAKKSPS